MKEVMGMIGVIGIVAGGIGLGILGVTTAIKGLIHNGSAVGVVCAILVCVGVLAWWIGDSLE